MRILVALVLLLAACTKRNANYCDGALDNHCMNAPDAPQRCDESHGGCVCLAGFCVQCTADDERNCTGATPECGDDNRCRGCRADDECASSACLADGSCADPSRVIYAAASGVNTPGCGRAVGQDECSITQALAEIDAPRDIIRLGPGTYGVMTADGLDFTRSATLIARSATVINRAAGTGPIATVRAQQMLTLVGGTLRGPNSSDGIRCDNGALRVHEATIEYMTESAIEGNSCELTVARSTLRGNLRGGINMIGDPKPVAITNNFIYRNGQASVSSIGGMVVRLAGSSQIELNTIVDNVVSTSSGLAGGVLCEGSYDAPHNLIYRNRGGLDDMVQVIGACTFMRSYVLAAAPSANDVQFQDPNNPTSPSFRLTAASPPGTILDAFDCRDLVDLEGDPRPAPAGGRCDLGADEFRVGQ